MAFVLPYLMHGCGADEYDDFNEYAAYADAVNDGAIEHGWIPPIVSASAFNISESHNLDSNAVWIHFEFDKADRENMISQSRSIQMKEVRFPHRFATRLREWWPKDLLRPSSSAQDKYDLYRFDYARGQMQMHGYLAVSVSVPEAWYWERAH